jgi:competence protein ComEC
MRTDSVEVQVKGLLHLYVSKKDSMAHPLLYGDIVQVLGVPSAIAPPTNPEEFNYSAYVARQQIHGQSFVPADRLVVIGHNPPYRVLEMAYELRAHLQAQTLRYISDPDAQAIALALLIGIKDFLSEDLTTAYASAGAMHVLAVSGLHVGILYMLLLLLLKPLEKRKGGAVLIAVLSVVVIWAYTFVTGMSPSVLRAATMFSVFAIAKPMSRSNNIYNSLGISAFILLLWDPNLLYAVGFQLSFLAVTGIVYLQPLIYRLLYVRNKYLDKIWVITAVSIAAQISTLPLTIYYFNQFPTYFFLSNLVVIPGAFLIMIGGIAMHIVGSMADGLGVVVGFLVDHLIQLMNYLVLLVEQIPGSLITWLYFDSVEVWGVYIFIVLFLIGFYHRSSLYLGTGLICLIVLFGRDMHRDWVYAQRRSLIVYDIKGTAAVDVVIGSNATLFVENDKVIDHDLLRFQIDPFRRANGLPPYQQGMEGFDQVIIPSGKMKLGMPGGVRVLILDAKPTDVNIHTPIETDILIVNNHSAPYTQWLLDHFRFETLIIGSDNSWGYSRRVKSELAEIGVQAHSLLDDGSFQMELLR